MPVLAVGVGSKLLIYVVMLSLLTLAACGVLAQPNTAPAPTPGANGEMTPELTPPATATEPPVVIMPGDAWRYFLGTEEPPAEWSAVSFDDSSWRSKSSGFGYGSTDYATHLDDMAGYYGSIYVRHSFTLEDPAAVKTLLFSIEYSDGFVAYLNGVEVIRRNIEGNPPSFNIRATAEDRASSQSVQQPPEQYDLSGLTHLLVRGTNVLAIQGHNDDLFSPNFVVSAALLGATAMPLDRLVLRQPYLRTPSFDGVRIVWATKGPGVPMVRYGLDELDHEVLGTSTPLPHLGGYHQHEVVLGNLEPDRRYAYGIFLDGVQLDVPEGLSFRTAPTPDPSKAESTEWQRGVSIRPRKSAGFASEAFRRSVDAIAATHANYITLIIPWTQPSIYSLDIEEITNASIDQTPTDAEVSSAIDYIHSKGMKVMLKPHLGVGPGGEGWGAYINPPDRKGWFNRYTNWITHYAQLAEDHNVEVITIGGEYNSMSTVTTNVTNTQNWIEVISAIRARFSGELTFSALWGPSGFVDEKNQIEFWPYLDYVGISAYFEFQNTLDTVTDIWNRWHEWNLQHVTPLYQRYNKPILFTEVGYRSTEGARNHPWEWRGEGAVDEGEQARLYEALFSYWESYPFMQGVHIWYWDNQQKPPNTGYTPYRKAAQAVITEWFGRMAGAIR